MAKNRKKGKSRHGDSMEISTSNDESGVQAMDVSEERAPNSNTSANRKIKKSVQMKRAKNLRKQKAKERAITCSDKSEVKILKSADKKSRVQSAKTLYD